MSTVWIPVLPSLKGFTKAVEGEARAAAKRGGAATADEFGKAGADSGRALADGLAKQSKLVGAASKRLASARNAEVSASAAVVKAETELDNLRKKGNASSSQIVRAEERLADAKRKAETAAGRLSRAEGDLATARDGGESTSRALVNAEDRVVNARNSAEAAAGKVRVAELRVSETRDAAAAKADAVTAAEDMLEAARTSGGTAEVERAERALETARGRSESAARRVIDAETSLSRSKADLETANDRVASASLSAKAVHEDVAATEKQLAREADSAAGSVDGLGDSMSEAEDKGRGFGGSLMDGIKNLGKGALLGAGATVGHAVVDGFGTAISSGMDRLGSIEQAETALGGLGHTAEETGAIMDNAMNAVTGTAFGFGDAAGLAGTLVASGIEPGQELERVLTLVGDSAAITGSGLNEMGSIWAKVAANGKLSAGEMNQFLDRNLGLLPQLAEHLNVTSEEARKMVSAGEVDFATFSEVMEGVVGGSAQAMGETFSGSFDNMRAALGRFGANLMDPIFSAAPAIFSAVSDVVDDLGERLTPVIEDMSEKLTPIFQDFADRLGPALSAAFDVVADTVATVAGAVSGLFQWMSENKGVVSVIGGALGGLAAALVAVRVQTLAVATAQNIMAAGGVLRWVKGMITSTKLWTGAQLLLNKAMNMNPIMRIVSVAMIAAGALAAFFTQTETGQEIWSGFMDILGGAWDWLTSTFVPIFQVIGDTVSTIFGVIWDVASTTIGVIGTMILAPLLVGWNLLSAGIQWGWENVIKPAWNALQTAAVWLWENVLSPVFGWIRTGWGLVAGGIQWYFENVILVAWNALQTAAVWLWENVLSPVFGWIRTGWEAMSTGIQWVFENIIRPTWDAVGSALSWLNDNIIQPVLGWIEDRWDTMSRAIEWVYDNVIQPVFDSIGEGLDVVKGVFETAVDGIETVWDGLRSAAAKPVKFVIERVWNDGILKAWNLIADFVPGLDTVEPYSPAWLGDYHQGTSNIVPGARSVGRDNMDFVSTDGRYGISLAGDEGIAHQHVVDGIGRSNWDRLNHVGRTRGASAVRDELGHFAGGGVIDLGDFSGGGVLAKNPTVDITTDIQRSMERAVAAAFPNQIITSGTRYEDVGSGYDNHMAGRALDFAPDQALANWIARTYPNSAELFWDPGPNLKNGSSTAAIGGHSDHVHWAMSEMVDPYTGDVVSQGGPGGGNGGGGNWLYRKAKDVWDSTVGRVGDWISDSTASWGDSLFATLPSNVYDETEQKVFNWIMDKIPFASGPGAGNIDWDVSAGARQWESVALSALKRLGYGVDDLERTIAQIDIESTGDPNSVNDWDDNAAIGDPTVGLLQVRGATFDMMRNTYPDAFAGLPNDRYDPEANITAGVAWADYRYGGPANIWPTRAGYDSGGWLQPMDGMQLVYNHTDEPEAVLTAAQWDSVSALPAEVRSLVAELSGNKWAAVADQAVAEFFERHPDPVGEALTGISDGVLDFFGMSGAWFTDPSALDVSWEASVPAAEVDPGVDPGDEDEVAIMADPSATVDDLAAANEDTTAATADAAAPANSDADAAAAPLTADADRVNLDRGFVQNIVMENVVTMDPDAAAREIARNARRAMAGLK